MSNELSDRQWMSRALQLARRGRYTCAPNPQVGCVLVKDGELVGEGFHVRTGEGHAEVNALRNAGDQAEGATAYVTLEPCSHTGRTGPCSLALIAAGIVRVVVAMRDPNPLVAGRGIKMLQEAGVAVEVGLLETEAETLLQGYVMRMRDQRPLVRLKVAMSLDGRTAMANGESQWITGSSARTQVQRMRAASSAVVTGVDTLLHDNSRLTVRAEQLGFEDHHFAQQVASRQPIRVIVDSQLRTPTSAACLSELGRTLVVTTTQQLDSETGKVRQAALKQSGAEVVGLSENSEGKVDLAALLNYLATTEQCNEVLVETGATLAGAFMQANLVNQVELFVAPTLLGSEARPLLEMPLATMSEQQRLNIVKLRSVGEDIWITAEPTNSKM